MRLLFLSTNGVWGGSEYLWFDTATRLARANKATIAFAGSYFVNEGARRDQLCTAGATWLPCGGRTLRLPRWQTLANRMLPMSYQAVPSRIPAWAAFDEFCPDAVVLSQGSLGLGAVWGSWLWNRQLPYVTVEHLVAWHHQPHLHNQLAEARNYFMRARLTAFVSQNNRELATALLGMEIPNACVVRNPTKSLIEFSPIAAVGADIRIACVARLSPMHKGQDLLLRILARPQWRSRGIHTSFCGEGESRQALEDFAKLLGVANIDFKGQVADVNAVYRNHQICVLPSRTEGQSIALLEAMLAGRIVVATDVGGAAELIVDGENGFLSDAPTVNGVDQAMERAWAARSRWSAITKNAASTAQGWIGDDPVGDFIVRLGQAFGNPNLAN